MGHTVRGAVSAWLALIVLQTVVTKGSGKVAGALSGVNGLVQRALSPNVPAIPDRRAGAAASSSGDGGFFRGLTPEQNKTVTEARNVTPEMLAAIRAAGGDPNSLINQLQTLNLGGVGNLGALNGTP